MVRPMVINVASSRSPAEVLKMPSPLTSTSITVCEISKSASSLKKPKASIVSVPPMRTTAMVKSIVIWLPTGPIRTVSAVKVVPAIVPTCVVQSSAAIPGFNADGVWLISNERVSMATMKSSGSPCSEAPSISAFMAMNDRSSAASLVSGSGVMVAIASVPDLTPMPRLSGTPMKRSVISR